MHGNWVLHEACLQLRGEAGERQVRRRDVAVGLQRRRPHCRLHALDPLTRNPVRFESDLAVRENSGHDRRNESGWTRRRNTLLSKYEQIAWNLFAKKGFREVTVDEIAEAAGVSSRTLFRYFPTKEDFLLGFTRRGLLELVTLIGELEPSSDPLQSVWRLIREHSLERPPDVQLLTLWRRAATDAPEIHARVRGERASELTEAVTDYCAESLGAVGSDDPKPRLLAGLVVGLEMAVIELWGRSVLTLPEILDAAEHSLPELRRTRRGTSS